MWKHQTQENELGTVETEAACFKMRPTEFSFQSPRNCDSLKYRRFFVERRHTSSRSESDEIWRAQSVSIRAILRWKRHLTRGRRRVKRDEKRSGQRQGLRSTKSGGVESPTSSMESRPINRASADGSARRSRRFSETESQGKTSKSKVGSRERPSISKRRKDLLSSDRAFSPSLWMFDECGERRLCFLLPSSHDVLLSRWP